MPHWRVWYPTSLFSFLDQTHEADVSTQQPQAAKDARLSRADAHNRRSERAPATPNEGSQASRCLNGPTRNRFDQIYRQGHRHSSRHYRLYVLPGEGRMGVATARSIGSHARRNRERRRAYHAFALTRPHQASHLDAVVAVSPASWHSSFEELLREARSLWDEVCRTWPANPASS